MNIIQGFRAERQWRRLYEAGPRAVCEAYEGESSTDNKAGDTTADEMGYSTLDEDQGTATEDREITADEWGSTAGETTVEEWASTADDWTLGEDTSNDED